MQKIFNFIYAFLFAILGIGVTLMAEEITLTTYYPAPYGAYDELTTTGNTYLATTAGASVAIGTTSPQAGCSLDVSGAWIKLGLEKAGGGRLHIGCNPNDNKIYLEGFSSDGTGNADEVLITGRFSGALPRMSIISTLTYVQGSLGIGVYTPGYPLDVAGNIHATGVVITGTTTYPDYVFEPGYKLMNIRELKDYVFENRHLPNMPSREEIKKDGIELFGQNKLLLEKLEEAYLHIFQLEERISRLEKRRPNGKIN